MVLNLESGMSTVRRLSLISVDDYLAGEQESTVKHEYLGGVVYAMVGARNVHNMIATNALVDIGRQLRGHKCRVFNSDTKIRVRLSSQTRFYYPDVSIICHPNPQTDVFQDQPAVIVEVLSESTRRIDEGEKRDAYLTMPTLTHYILLEQSAPAAIVYERGEPGFKRRVLSDLSDRIEISEINVTLELATVYNGVEFSEESA